MFADNSTCNQQGLLYRCPSAIVFSKWVNSTKLEHIASSVWLYTVLKVVRERSWVSRNPRSSAPSPEFCNLFLIWKIGKFWCMIGCILCDFKLQESKQETRYRPGSSKGAGSPTLVIRPHFKSWLYHLVNANQVWWHSRNRQALGHFQICDLDRWLLGLRVITRAKIVDPQFDHFL